jgi:hypothetical protein
MKPNQQRTSIVNCLFWCCALAFFFLSGCSKPVPPIGSQVDQSVRGEWSSDRGYSNDYFGITISIPSEWGLLKGDEQNLEFMLKSIGITSGGNSAVENAMRQQFSKIHVPMRSLVYPDEEYSKNPNVLVMIENTVEDPSIKTGEDYLIKMEKTMNLSSQFPKFDGPPFETIIDGVSYWTRSSTLEVNGGEGVLFSGAGGYVSRQRGYTIVKGNYALTILCTCFSSKDDPTADFASKHIASMQK